MKQKSGFVKPNKINSPLGKLTKEKKGNIQIKLELKYKLL